MKHVSKERAHRTSNSTVSGLSVNEDADANAIADADGVVSTQMSDAEEDEMIYLIKMLKGFQHFDSICTELRKSRTEVEKMIEKLGSFSVINC